MDVLGYTIEACKDIKDPKYDVVIVVTDTLKKLTGDAAVLNSPLQSYAQLDQGCTKEPVLIATNVVPSGRVIFSPTGPLNRDQDDVRRFYDAAVSGLKRAITAGCRKPLLLRAPDKTYTLADRVTTLGALHALYLPLELKDVGRKNKVDVIGLFTSDTELTTVRGLEAGRTVTRDIGGSDQERMAAPKIVEYLEKTFRGTSVKMEVITNVDTLTKEYPLLAAVNRAANTVTRHQGRVVHLEYTGEGQIEETLCLVGKGITYDTGGADVKAGGIMAGMHRDKCGAAAVAGFFKVLAELKPKNIRVLGTLACIRNSIGEESYTADEIITSRAGVRVRVGNTDAEGRMVMTDPLARMKEKALNEVNPHLFTVATLTGHVIRCYGDQYTAVCSNGPATDKDFSRKIQTTGHECADPIEVSTIRREDYEFATGKSEYEDVLQCNNVGSSSTPRGHQFPAAFMIMASGLDKHGRDSTRPLAYTHIDCAGSSGPFPGVPTASPLLVLAHHYVIPRL